MRRGGREEKGERKEREREREIALTVPREGREEKVKRGISHRRQMERKEHTAAVGLLCLKIETDYEADVCTVYSRTFFFIILSTISFRCFSVAEGGFFFLGQQLPFLQRWRLVGWLVLHQIGKRKKRLVVVELLLSRTQKKRHL